MTLNVNPVIGENQEQPGIWASAYIPDQLIAGNLKLVTSSIILATGTLPRGSVLGLSTTNNVIAVAGASNTGNGTVSSVTSGAGALFGTYQLTATSATEFSVTDPEGNTLPQATVGSTYSDEGIGFTIAAGTTAFVAGDSFALAVEETAGTYNLSVATATDGSQVPSAILADYADASAGPVTTAVYLMGEFNQNAINYDPSWNLGSLKFALSKSQIFIKSVVSAADPT
ncbi:head decoration protein [Paraburkholderia ferrariae]|uniref:head decoration protein n=1 Tax=Paraburkholderia ferrariae TaxID=386056 RepID=UPI000694BDFB|nr:head decoration protein [Paraburkholderia ferrariae]